MKDYKLTFTVNIKGQDDPAARHQAKGVLEAVAEVVPSLNVKLQEVFSDKPPRSIHLSID